MPHDALWLVLPTVVLGVVVAGFIEDWAIRRSGHRYGTCPGCGERIVRAFFRDGERQCFDAMPLPIATPATALFIFNPVDRIERWRKHRHVRGGEGLTLHHCALGRRKPGKEKWSGNVPWRIPGDGSATLAEASGRGRRRWLAFGAAVVGFVVVFSGGLALIDMGGRDDARACPGSEQNLDAALAHFGIALPDDASNVRYSSSSRPLLGEYAILVGFRTTPDGLTRFRVAARLMTQDWSPRSLVTVDRRCGELELQQLNLRVSDVPRPGTGRALDVDLSDPRHPFVLFQAVDV